MQTRDFGVLEYFYFPSGIGLPSLILLGKLSTCVGLGIKQPSTFEKAKIPVSQIKALGITQARIPFELYVSVSKGGMSSGLWQSHLNDRICRISISGLEGSRNPIYLHRAIALNGVHSSPPGRASHKGTACRGKTFPSYQSVS